MVQTAWALLGLLAADCKDVSAVQRGIRYLMRKQVGWGAHHMCDVMLKLQCFLSFLIHPYFPLLLTPLSTV